jgi:hypothetical protein
VYIEGGERPECFRCEEVIHCKVFRSLEVLWFWVFSYWCCTEFLQWKRKIQMILYDMDKVLNVSEVGRWLVVKCLRAWKFCDSGLFVQQQSCLRIVLQLSQHSERLKQYKHLLNNSSVDTIKNIENTSGGDCHQLTCFWVNDLLVDFLRFITSLTLTSKVHIQWQRMSQWKRMGEVYRPQKHSRDI